MKRENRVCKNLEEIRFPLQFVKDVGFQNTGPGFSVGPLSIPLFGLVFVEKGTGWAMQAGHRFQIQGGDVFLVFPNTKYSFSSEGDSWEQYWLTFNVDGLRASLTQVGLMPGNFLRRGCNTVLLKETFERILCLAPLRHPHHFLNLALQVGILLDEMVRVSLPMKQSVPPGLYLAQKYIEEHTSSSISIDALARIACLSRFHFMRAFKDQFGVSPIQYQIRRRMAEARKLLCRDVSVKEVCSRVGYEDLFYFSKLFKQKCGVSPSGYQRQHRSNSVV